MWLTIRNYALLLDFFIINIMARHELAPQLGSLADLGLISAISIGLFILGINKVKTYRVEDIDIYPIGIIFYVFSVILILN